MARTTVDRTGDTIVARVSDVIGRDHEIVLDRPAGEELIRALIPKVRADGHDAIDDLLARCLT